MNSATIPLAALVTFAAVYWLAPAPAVSPRMEPSPVGEARPPAAAGEAEAAAAAARTTVPAPIPAAKPRRAVLSRPIRTRRTFTEREESGRPVRAAPEAGVYFAGCNAVRAAGRAPLYIGRPGYRPEMDGDSDGIACEPYRGQ